MSRSYKHSPWSTDYHLHNTMKRYANKKVRHTKGNFKGNNYKKIFCSYDICDYKMYYPLQEAVEYYNRHAAQDEDWILREYPTLQDYIIWWKHYYYFK